MRVDVYDDYDNKVVSRLFFSPCSAISFAQGIIEGAEAWNDDVSFGDIDAGALLETVESGKIATLRSFPATNDGKCFRVHIYNTNEHMCVPEEERRHK